MINSVNHDSVSRLVVDRPMCLATALDKAFENIDCMSAILRCQAKNRFYESTQRLIQPRPVLWYRTIFHHTSAHMHHFSFVLAGIYPNLFHWDKMKVPTKFADELSRISGQLNRAEMLTAYR